MSIDWDPEVPAGYQDADILQAQYEAESAEFARREAEGFCHHSSGLGHRDPECYNADDIAKVLATARHGNRGGFTGSQSDIGVGNMLCYDCGAVVDDPFEGR